MGGGGGWRWRTRVRVQRFGEWHNPKATSLDFLDFEKVTAVCMKEHGMEKGLG